MRWHHVLAAAVGTKAPQVGKRPRQNKRHLRAPQKGSSCERPLRMEPQVGASTQVGERPQQTDRRVGKRPKWSSSECPLRMEPQVGASTQALMRQKNKISERPLRVEPQVGASTRVGKRPQKQPVSAVTAQSSGDRLSNPSQAWRELWAGVEVVVCICLTR